LTDSTKTPHHKISYFGKDTVTIGVGVRDNHAATVVDSFHIYYNAPPENIRMLLPTNEDTILFHTIDSTFFQKRVAFRFTAFDRNGATDSLLFSLYLGKSPGLLEKFTRDEIPFLSPVTSTQRTTSGDWWRTTNSATALRAPERL